MASITETIAALDRQAEQERAKLAAQPLVIYGGTIDLKYQQTYPACPYGQGFFPSFIEKDKAYLNEFPETANATFNEVTNLGFKKPGFFGKNKKHRLEVFWVNAKLLEWQGIFSFNSALKRKDNSEVPVSATEWYNFRFNTFDAKVFKDWCKRVKRNLTAGAVLLRYGDVDSLITYDVRYNLGDLYVNKFIGSGKYSITKTVDTAPTTSDQKISIMLADSASKLLGNIGFKVWKGRIVRFNKQLIYC